MENFMENRPCFDWYQATLGLPLRDVKDILRNEIPECVEERARPVRNYTRAVKFSAGDTPLLTLMSAPDMDPHLLSTGPVSQPVADIVKMNIQPHYISRVDACVDYDAGQGTWEELTAVIRPVIQKAGVQSYYFGPDPLATRSFDQGRTLYYGAKSSAVRVRCYEKGLEVMAKGGEASPSMCRLELQYRPAKSVQKKAASRFTAEQVLTVSPWSRKLLEAIEKRDFPRVRVPQPPVKSMDQSLQWMCNQWKRQLRAKFWELGGNTYLLGKYIMENCGGDREQNSGLSPTDDVPF